MRFADSRPLELRVVGAEQEDVGRARRELVVERLPRAPRRKPLVRVRRRRRGTGSSSRAPRRRDEDEERARARPGSSAASAGSAGSLSAPARAVSAPAAASGACAEPSLGPAAAVDPVGLLSGRHPAGYGSRRPWSANGDRRGRRRDEDPRRSRRPRRDGRSATARPDADRDRGRRCSTASRRPSASSLDESVVAVGFGIPSRIDQRTGHRARLGEHPARGRAASATDGRAARPPGRDRQRRERRGDRRVARGRGRGARSDMVMLTLGTGRRRRADPRRQALPWLVRRRGRDRAHGDRPRRRAVPGVAGTGIWSRTRRERPRTSWPPRRSDRRPMHTASSASRARAIRSRSRILDRDRPQLGSGIGEPRQHLQPGADRHRRGLRGRRRAPVSSRRTRIADREVLVLGPRLATGSSAPSSEPRRHDRCRHGRLRGARDGLGLMPLAVCATPIGNLEDVTLRVLRELRRGGRRAVRGHSPDARAAPAARDPGEARSATTSTTRRSARQSCCRGSRRGSAWRWSRDAGLPGDQRPGRSADRSRARGGRAVTVLPGPSAVETALVASGSSAERYQFVGYLPRGEQALRALWEELRRWPWPAVAFESPQRLPATLRSLADALPGAASRRLPRADEAVRGGRARAAPPRWRSAFAEPPKGEITLVLDAWAGEGPDEDAGIAAVSELVGVGVPRRQAADLVARLTGTSRNALYRGSL